MKKDKKEFEIDEEILSELDKIAEEIDSSTEEEEKQESTWESGCTGCWGGSCSNGITG